MEASPSGGLACTVAALAERQHMGEESSNTAESSNPVFDHTLQHSTTLTSREERSIRKYPSKRWIEVSPESGIAVTGEEESEWSVEDHGSEIAEAGTSYTSSEVAAVETAGRSASVSDDGANMTSAHLIPESFEEQMMLAMAVSLAEARARSSPQGVTWM